MLSWLRRREANRLRVEIAGLQAKLRVSQDFAAWHGTRWPDQEARWMARIAEAEERIRQLEDEAAHAGERKEPAA